MKQFQPSELPITQEGRVYHLNLKPEEISDQIILVGDPNRVARISRYFDEIYIKVQNREFITHTGRIGSTPLSVISTGMGTSNIDVVMTELDVLVNLDFNQKCLKSSHHKLSILRIGTAGGLQPYLKIGDFVFSDYAIGLDGLMHYYQYTNTTNEDKLQKELNAYLGHQLPIAPYVAQASWHDKFASSNHYIHGITATCLGFYGPQNRYIRVPIACSWLLGKLTDFNFDSLKVTNFEMETSAILALGNQLKHQCASLSVVINNRTNGTFSSNPIFETEKLIASVMDLFQHKTSMAH